MKTATEFQAAADAGEIVEFEIAYAYVLRSDMPVPAEFLKKRLKNMLEEERFWAQRGRGGNFRDAQPVSLWMPWRGRDRNSPAGMLVGQPGCNRAKAGNSLERHVQNPNPASLRTRRGRPDHR